MNTSKNPHQEFSVDDISRIQLPDIGHKIWAKGHSAGKKDQQVIYSAIKAQNGMVLVFDEKGEQIPRYQGQYEEVKRHILEQAPPCAVFSYAFDYESGLKTVPREEW